MILPLTLSITSGSLCAKERSQREPTAIVDSHRLPAPQDLHLVYRGKLNGGKSYFVRLDKNPRSKFLAISASIGKLILGRALIDIEEYSEIDLSPFMGVSADSVELIFKFGDFRTQCYINDDGRDRVTVWFSTQRPPEINVTSFKNCEHE